jgi:ABC-type glutathione transport system ATPase component
LFSLQRWCFSLRRSTDGRIEPNLPVRPGRRLRALRPLDGLAQSEDDTGSRHRGWCDDGDVPVAISTSGLTKSFGSTGALDGLDLAVEAGEVHGFLGPNGSGKTTTIRVLLGLLRADSGEVELLGRI